MPVFKKPEEAFANIGTEPSLKIWWVQDKNVSLQRRRNHGVFYSSHCYIVCHTLHEHGELKRVIHFWVGNNVSDRNELISEEIAVQLDDFVNSAIFLRHVQGFESRSFMDHFPKGVKYLLGVCGTRTRRLQNGEYSKRLYRVKGKRNLRITEMNLTCHSLNSGDSFVLEDEWKIYCWNGKGSSKVERIKAMEVARTIRDELCYGKAEIIVAYEGVDVKNEKRFFNELGGDKPSIPSDQSGDDDPVWLPVNRSDDHKLYRVRETDQNIEIEDVTETPLRQRLLDSWDCFIVDGGNVGLYIWIGKKCTQEEKRASTKTAIRFINEKGYPPSTPVTRVLEGQETDDFKRLFLNWSEKTIVFKDGRVNVDVVEYEIGARSNNKMSNGLHQEVTNASVTVKIWRIEGFKKVPWPIEHYGTFYEGDSYIILYSFTAHSRREYIIYKWLGSTSSPSEKERCADLARLMDEKLEGRTTRASIIQGKEPEQFLRIFNGRLIILIGGVDSDSIDRISKTEQGNRDIFKENDNALDNSIMFFRIHGTTPYNTKATQIPPSAEYLDSDDAFLLKLENRSYVWEGKGSNDDEKDMAEYLAFYVSPKGDITLLQEGFETEDFWRNLGYKSEYNLEKKVPSIQRAARLYHCSDASGTFVTQEVISFDQEDLQEDDVMLLDAGDEVYVWIGNGANENEKKGAWSTAMEYIDTDPTGRSIDNTSIIQIKQGMEPKSFTDWFHQWDSKKMTEMTSYEQMRKEIEQENKMLRKRSGKSKRADKTSATM